MMKKKFFNLKSVVMDGYDGFVWLPTGVILRSIVAEWVWWEFITTLSQK
jgi:heme exporter protein D